MQIVGKIIEPKEEPKNAEDVVIKEPAEQPVADVNVEELKEEPKSSKNRKRGTK